MSQVLILLRKSLLTFSRARAAIAITFAVPIGLIYLFGHVFGLYRKDEGPVGIPVAVVNLSAEPAAQKLIAALQAEPTFQVITNQKLGRGATRPLTEADARAGLHNNEYRYALILPAELFPDDGIGVRIRFLFDPRNEIESQTVTGLLQKTIFSSVPQLLGQSLQRQSRRLLGQDRFEQLNRTMAGAMADAFGGDREAVYQKAISGDFGLDQLGRAPASAAAGATPGGVRPLDPNTGPVTPAAAAGAPSPAGPAHSTSGDFFARIVKIESEQVAGKQLKNPMAARLVGGYAVMFLLMAVSSSATTLFEEKQTGVFQRLLSAPVRPAHILWARFLFGITLGLVQIAALLVAGRCFYGLEIFAHPGALLAVALSTAAACSAFGMLVTALAPSAAAASGIATFVVISMSAVGGAWFPVSFMPSYIQSFSKLTLVYWAVEGFADVLWAGNSFFEVLPKVAILVGIATAVMLIAIWRFNRGKLFD